MESFTIEPSDLPFCVNNEWDVDPSGKVTASARGEGTLPYVLHFMTYIPPKNTTPLSLRRDTEQTQSFFVPSWGGVHILNKHRDKESLLPSKGADLNEEDEQSIAEAAVTMLRLSLGFDEMPQEKGITHVRFLDEGFAENEMEWLVLKKLTQDTETSVHILLSLVDLVDTIPNLEVPDLIQDQVCPSVPVALVDERVLEVLASLAAVETTLSKLKAGDVTGAAQAASHSKHLAELAFSHPAIVSKENFPTEHKLGMYLPLFLPVLLSTAVTCLSLFSRRS